MKKPTFWSKNPYPVSIFPTPEEQYPEIVPDPELRTALLGRRFWDIALDAIWAAMVVYRAMIVNWAIGAQLSRLHQRVEEYQRGVDGPETYLWETGTPP